MKKLGNISGFTLIEIVMVLVLLGILAAVAAPKYFDLADSARKRAANGAIAEVQGRMDKRFAEELLQGKICSEALDRAKEEVMADDGAFHVGDWTITATADSTEKIYTVSKVANSTWDSDVTYTESPVPTITPPLCSSN